MRISVNITHIGRRAFNTAMEMAFMDMFDLNHPKQIFCNGYKMKDGWLVLCSYSEDCEKFLYPYSKERAVEFAWGWLESVKPTDPYPDTDGTVKTGFEASTDNTGVGSSDWGTIVAVRPVYIIYGK